MKIKFVLAAAAMLFSAAGAQAVSIAPAGAVDAGVSTSAVEQIQYRRGYGRGRNCRVIRRRSCFVNRRGVRVCNITVRRRCY